MKHQKLPLVAGCLAFVAWGAAAADPAPQPAPPVPAAPGAAGGKPLPVPQPVPEPPFVVDQREKFEAIAPSDARAEALGGPVGLGEGPVWIGGDDGHLIFSSVEDNEMLQWSAAGGVKSFRKPSGRANGNAVDARGRLISCEMGGRRVVRAEPDGQLAVLADAFEGKKLNSPNDIAVKSDGTIWFSDPPYGIAPRMKEQAGNYLFRLDPATGALAAVVKDREMPNGVAFAPDEKRLYVADSSKGRWIWAYDVGPDNVLGGGRQFAQIDTGISDGITVDSEGNLYSSAPDGVHIFDAAGKRIGKILLPWKAVNVEFGGPGRSTLFVTTRGPLMRIGLKARGLPPHGAAK